MIMISSHKVSNNTLCFKHWIQSDIIYIKDLFDIKGDWISESGLCQKLNVCKNWIAEYLMVKKAIGKSYKKFNTTLASYINIKDKVMIHYGNNVSEIKHQTSNLYYSVLRGKLCIKPYIENYWNRSFQIENVYNILTGNIFL